MTKENKFGAVHDPMIITGFTSTFCKGGDISALSRAMLSVKCAASGAQSQGLTYSIWMGFKTKPGGG
jgi:hypothetical protein